MEGKIGQEGLERHQENQKVKEEMCERMDKGFKNEESARKLLQRSGSTACSEAITAVGKGARGTFARPPLGIAARYNEIFVPRKMEFKGWVTNYTRGSCQGLAMDEVVGFVVDLKHMIPLNAQRFVD